MKLSKNQEFAISILKRYPDDIIMSDGWLTGGHGIRLDKRTTESLKKKGIIEKWGNRRDRLSELGMSLPIEPFKYADE